MMGRIGKVEIEDNQIVIITNKDEDKIYEENRRYGGSYPDRASS